MQLDGKMSWVVDGRVLVMPMIDECTETVPVAVAVVDEVDMAVVGENMVIISKAVMSPLKATQELAQHLQMQEMLMKIVKVCCLFSVVMQPGCFIVDFFSTEPPCEFCVASKCYSLFVLMLIVAASHQQLYWKFIDLCVSSTVC